MCSDESNGTVQPKQHMFLALYQCMLVVIVNGKQPWLMPWEWCIGDEGCQLVMMHSATHVSANWREYVRDGESRVHSATSAKHISGKQCVVVMRVIAHCNKATHVSGSRYWWWYYDWQITIIMLEMVHACMHALVVKELSAGDDQMIHSMQCAGQPQQHMCLPCGESRWE